MKLNKGHSSVEYLICGSAADSVGSSLAVKHITQHVNNTVTVIAILTFFLSD